jgi:NADPH:quinone reductase
VIYGRESFVDRVQAITGGEGVRVVYDSVGKDTFGQSLDCLRTRGMLVLFGQSSGMVAPFDPALLAKRCLYLTRPSLFAYVATRPALLQTAQELFDVVGSRTVSVRVAQEFALREAAEAHRALEARRTTGSTVLRV